MQILRRCHVSVPHPGVHLWLHFSISSARRTKSVQKWINDTCTNPHFFFWMLISLNSLTLTEKTVQYHSEVGNGFKNVNTVGYHILKQPVITNKQTIMWLDVSWRTWCNYSYLCLRVGWGRGDIVWISSDLVYHTFWRIWPTCKKPRNIILTNCSVSWATTPYHTASWNEHFLTYM